MKYFCNWLETEVEIFFMNHLDLLACYMHISPRPYSYVMSGTCCCPDKQQCDQIDILFDQYLIIYSDENLPN